MSKPGPQELIVGLDIGTADITVIVGEKTDDGNIEVIGIGSQTSRGIKRGVVVDIESTTRSIQRAVEQAELMANCDIRGVITSISGTHISSQNSHGMYPVREQEVSEGDVQLVLEAARALSLPADRHLLHVLPQEYIIDSQGGIQHPVGMSGLRLEVKAHLVTCAESAVLNINKCVTRCGLELDRLVAQQLASAKAVLNEDEKELGVCLVDIGAGTTDIAVYCQGAIKLTAVIPVAGDQITNDIAVALKTPTQHAEDIKIQHACALVQLASNDEIIQVPSVGDREPRPISRQVLAGVIQPRYEELFSLVQDEIRRNGLEELISVGIVLTGGSAKMEGVTELAEEVFNMPVRVGSPAEMVSGLADVVSNQIHASGVGLILWEEDEMEDGKWQRNEDSLLDRFKKWFRGEW